MISNLHYCFPLHVPKALTFPQHSASPRALQQGAAQSSRQGVDSASLPSVAVMLLLMEPMERMVWSSEQKVTKKERKSRIRSTCCTQTQHFPEDGLLFIIINWILILNAYQTSQILSLLYIKYPQFFIPLNHNPNKLFLLQTLIQMENKIKVSRSVVVDPIFKKSMEQSYEKHKQKLQQIKKRKLQNETYDIDDVLRRKLSVKQAHEKVKQELDPVQYEKKSMISHIKGILERKSESFFEIKKYKNSVVENEKREIERQNKILSEKIKEKKAQKMTKKDLRKQFAEYESQKNLIRKVWYESARTSKGKRKEKSLERLSHDHHHQ